MRSPLPEYLALTYTADDLDGAVEVAARIPAAWGGAVEIRPILLQS